MDIFQPITDAIQASLSKKRKMPGQIHGISNECRDEVWNKETGHFCFIRFDNGTSWRVFFTSDDDGNLVAKVME